VAQRRPWLTVYKPDSGVGEQSCSAIMELLAKPEAKVADELTSKTQRCHGLTEARLIQQSGAPFLLLSLHSGRGGLL
jgi:hypothetical protein